MSITIVLPDRSGTDGYDDFVNAVGEAIRQPLIDSDGTPINPDAMAQTLGYDAAGNLVTITATDGASTWVQTLSYSSGALTGISQWEKQ